MFGDSTYDTNFIALSRSVEFPVDFEKYHSYSLLSVKLENNNQWVRLPMPREYYSFTDMQFSVLLPVLFPGVIVAIKILLAMHFSSEEQQLSSYSLLQWDINPERPGQKRRLVRDSDHKRSSLKMLRKPLNRFVLLFMNSLSFRRTFVRINCNYIDVKVANSMRTKPKLSIYRNFENRFSRVSESLVFYYRPTRISNLQHCPSQLYELL